MHEKIKQMIGRTKSKQIKQLRHSNATLVTDIGEKLGYGSSIQ